MRTVENTFALLRMPVLVAGVFFASLSGAPAMTVPVGDSSAIPMTVAKQTAAAPGLKTLAEQEQAMSPSERIGRWDPIIKEAALRFNVAAEWIRAVMRIESGGRTMLDDKPITSQAGAMGVMQVMPATYEDMKEQYGLGDDPYDPRDNVMAGTAYLSWLYERYGFPRLFAAYNAGPGTVEAQAAHHQRQLPSETRAYIKNIASILGTNISYPESSEAFKSGSAGNATSGKAVATFTRPDGVRVAINAAKVSSVRAALPNEFVPGVKTVLSLGAMHQGVKENVATVIALLRRHKG